jgi:hypothetical protein
MTIGIGARFFEEVADRAPIPIVIYNFPNLLSGLDVNSDMLEPMEHRWYQDQGKIGPVLVGGLNLDQDVAGGASQ